MANLVIATCTTRPGLQPSDRLLADALAALGHGVDDAPWNGAFAPFAAADLVVVRSTWDYWNHFDAYLGWFDALDNAGKTVANPTSLMRWNVRKDYLFELQDKGAPVAPGARVPADAGEIAANCVARGWRQAVLKPIVSAGAHGLSLFDASDDAAIAAAVEAARPWAADGLMLQPFFPEIRTSGECSLCFFDGRFSHAVRKTPKAGDIRSQAEYGASTVRWTPPEWAIRAAEETLTLLPEAPAFARVDGLVLDDRFVLMELEVTEPELFFHVAPDAAKTCAEALIAPL